MKIKKTLAALCALAVMLASFASCGYEISIKKKDRDKNGGQGTGRDTSSAVSEETTAKEYNDDIPVYSAPEEDEKGTEEKPSEPSVSSAAAIDGSYSDTGMSAAEVINTYKSAMNGVKTDAPGYIKDESIGVSDVSAFGKGETQLANNIIGLVATEVIKGQGDTEDGPIRIRPNDIKAVKNTFPLFGQDSGCAFTDLSLVTSAVCYANKDSYKIVITLADQLNPAKGASEYGKIMNPIDRDSIYGSIKEYFVVLDTEQYQFDINYTQNKIVCTIDRATGHMTGLSMQTVMDIDINLNMNLIVFKTSAFKVSGKIKNVLSYSEFDWS